MPTSDAPPVGVRTLAAGFGPETPPRAEAWGQRSLPFLRSGQVPQIAHQLAPGCTDRWSSRPLHDDLRRPTRRCADGLVHSNGGRCRRPSARAVVVSGWIAEIRGNDPRRIMFLLIAGFAVITPPYGLPLSMASKFVDGAFAPALRASAPICVICFVNCIRDFLSDHHSVAPQASAPGVGRRSRHRIYLSMSGGWDNRDRPDELLRMDELPRSSPPGSLLAFRGRSPRAGMGPSIATGASHARAKCSHQYRGSGARARSL
jgi:hypothetical protein